MTFIFGLSFVLELIASAVFNTYIGRISTLTYGALSCANVSIAWIAKAIGTNSLYGRKSLRLYLTNADYFVVFFVVMGGILGAW